MRAGLLCIALLIAPVSHAQQADGDPERVRVVRPSAAEGAEPVAEPSGAGEEDGQTKWQRARAKRFKRVPGTQGEIKYQGSAPVPIQPVRNALQGGAVLRHLDKMTGQTKTVEMGSGTTAQIARLRISLDACRAPEGNAAYGTMAFVRIWDTKYPERPPVFSGWMFADSPALSGLDHPRYDLWVIRCTISEAAESSPKE